MQKSNEVGTLLYLRTAIPLSKRRHSRLFMPVGDVDKGQKPYYNDTRMQRELLREAERKDKSFDLYT